MDIFIVTCDDRDYDSGGVENVIAFDTKAAADGLAARLNAAVQEFAQIEKQGAKTDGWRMGQRDRFVKYRIKLAEIVERPELFDIDRTHHQPYMGVDVLIAGFDVLPMKVYQ